MTLFAIALLLSCGCFAKCEMLKLAVGMFLYLIIQFEYKITVRAHVHDY